MPIEYVCIKMPIMINMTFDRKQKILYITRYPIGSHDLKKNAYCKPNFEFSGLFLFSYIFLNRFVDYKESPSQKIK